MTVMLRHAGVFLAQYWRPSCNVARCKRGEKLLADHVTLVQSRAWNGTQSGFSKWSFTLILCRLQGLRNGAVLVVEINVTQN